MESRVVRPLKFQWKKNQRQVSGFASISPQQESKLGSQRNKSKAIFFILGSFVNICRYDVDFLASIEMKMQRALWKWNTTI